MNSSEAQLSQPVSEPSVGQELQPNPVTPTRSVAAFQEGTGPRSRMGLSSYIELPFVHKRTIIVSLLSCMFLGWLAILLWPRSYESEAKLMVLVGRESVALDPTATTGQTLMLQKTQEEEINSVLEVLGSRRVAELVVDQLGETAIINGVLPAANGKPPTTFQKLKAQTQDTITNFVDACVQLTGVRDNISDREMAIRKLQKSIKIYAPKKSTVVSIHGESKTPEMAQALVQTVCDQFMNEYLAVSHTEGSRDFFHQQAIEAEEKLNQMDDERSDYMQDRKIVSIDDNRRLLTSQLASVNSDLMTALAELEQTNSEIQDLSDKVAEAADEVVANKLEQSDQTWSAMRTRVYELELQERNLAAIYTDGNERLAQVRKQLEGAREILAKAQMDRVDESRTPNPAKLAMKEDLRRLQTRVVGLTAAIETKREQKRSIEKAINDLLVFELELTEMDRHIAVAQTRLRVLQEKLEEARVIDQLQSERISNINQFQQATFVERAAKPSKKVLAAAFVMLGLLTGFGLAYMRELCSDSLRTSDHIENGLDCRVLTSVPRSREAGNMQRVIRGSQKSQLRHFCKSILSDVILSRPRSQAGELRGRTLGVLGVESGCGASTLSAALAMTASEDGGLRTTLIDADLRQRTVSSAFGLNGAPGLAEMLAGQAEHRECVQKYEQSPLDLISGSAPTAQGGFEVDPRIVNRTLLEFQQDCDLTIVDLPPASRLDQATSIVRELDQVVVVVESGRTKLTDARRVLRRMVSADTEVIGVVLNKTNEQLPRWLKNLVG